MDWLVRFSQITRLFDGNETVALIADKAAVNAGLTHTEAENPSLKSSTEDQDVKWVGV